MMRQYHGNTFIVRPVSVVRKLKRTETGLKITILLWNWLIINSTSYQYPQYRRKNILSCNY